MNPSVVENTGQKIARFKYTDSERGSIAQIQFPQLRGEHEKSRKRPWDARFGRIEYGGDYGDSTLFAQSIESENACAIAVKDRLDGVFSLRPAPWAGRSCVAQAVA